MKNKFIYIARMAALSLLLAATACEDTLIAPAPGIAGDGPTLTLTLDNNEEKAGTRSELASSAPTNHVTTVRILVFQQMTDGAEPVYVGQEDPDIDWLNYNTDEQLELGERSRITYRLNYPFEKGATYTLLGVAMDKGFNDDYTLEVEGKNLSNAVAILKDGKTGTDIAEHEFFTGTTTFTHEGRDTHIDDLLMKRRVAGILLYVTDVPQIMTGSNGDCRTTAIRLRLGEKDNVTLQQNKSVTLYRDLEDENWTEPDTPTQQPLEDSNVLTTIDISSWTYTPNKECYMETIGGVEQIKKSDPTGLYILPLTTDNSTPTLQVDIVGKADSDADGTPDDGAQEEVLKTLTVQNMSETGQPTAFSLRSNYIYSIGKYNPDQDIDQPISLLGEAIYLEVLPFTSVPTEHEFGEARVHALFDHSDNPIHNCMNKTFTVRILPPLTTLRQYITSIVLDIPNKTIVKNNENGDIEEEETNGYYSNWLYIQTVPNPVEEIPNQFTRNSYDITEEAKDEAFEVTLFMEDYARPRLDWGWNLEAESNQWQGSANEIRYINNDVRYTDIRLTTNYEINGIKDSRTDTLRIKQFNTITVNYKGWNGEIATCGFSREDVKDDEGKDVTCQWGFYTWDDTSVEIVNSTIYGTNEPQGQYEDGAWNTANIGWATADGTEFQPLWSESAHKKTQHMFNRVDETLDGYKWVPTPPTINKDSRTTACWYLPAEFEMEGFMIMSANRNNGQINTNIKEIFSYWTSTLEDSPNAKAYTYYESGGSYGYHQVKYRRDIDGIYIRPARKFQKYYTQQDEVTDHNW